LTTHQLGATKPSASMGSGTGRHHPGILGAIIPE
jgi:hypothetical protein